MEPELGQMCFGNKWEQHEAPPFVGSDLYDLSEMLGGRDPDNQAHGLLGGEWGYGQEFENDVFEMHPYYWGDCTCGFDEADSQWDEEHSHAPECYQTELHKREEAYGEPSPEEYRGDFTTGHWAIAPTLAREWGLPEQGCGVHCTCTHDGDYAKWRQAHDHDPKCPEVLPNFRYKPSMFVVHWYKYIGRSMSVNRPITSKEWRALITECQGSITS